MTNTNEKIKVLHNLKEIKKQLEAFYFITITKIDMLSGIVSLKSLKTGNVSQETSREILNLVRL